MGCLGPQYLDYVSAFHCMILQHCSKRPAAASVLLVGETEAQNEAKDYPKVTE